MIISKERLQRAQGTKGNFYTVISLRVSCFHIQPKTCHEDEAFVQDNNPKHTARNAKKWFADNDVHLFSPFFHQLAQYLGVVFGCLLLDVEIWLANELNNNKQAKRTIQISAESDCLNRKMPALGGTEWRLGGGRGKSGSLATESRGCR